MNQNETLKLKGGDRCTKDRQRKDLSLIKRRLTSDLGHHQKSGSMRWTTLRKDFLTWDRQLLFMHLVKNLISLPPLVFLSVHFFSRLCYWIISVSTIILSERAREREGGKEREREREQTIFWWWFPRGGLFSVE